MFDQQKRLNIARTVCSQFVREAASTKEHALLVEFKDPQLLSDMQTRNQLKLNPTTNEFQPAVGAFALLPDDDGLNQLAKDGFLRTVPLLLKLFCDKGEPPKRTRPFFVWDSTSVASLDSFLPWLGQRMVTMSRPSASRSMLSPWKTRSLGGNNA